MDRLVAFVAGAVFGGAVVELMSPPQERQPDGLGNMQVTSAGATGYSTAHLVVRIQTLVSEIRSLTRHVGQSAANKPGGAAGLSARPPLKRMAGEPSGYLEDRAGLRAMLLDAAFAAAGAAAAGWGIRKGGGTGALIATGGILMALSHAVFAVAGIWTGKAGRGAEGWAPGSQGPSVSAAGAARGH